MSIYLVIAINFSCGVAVQASRLVLPLYALKLDASALTVGILGASFAILPLLLSLPAGRIADRFGTRWLLIIAAFIGALSMLLPYFVAEVTAIFIAAMIMGLSFGMYNVSLQTLVGSLSTQDTRTRNFSNYSLSNSAANFAAPLIAGFSVEHFGHEASCLYLAFLTLVPIVFLAVWGGALPRGNPEAAHAKRGIQSLLSEPGVKRNLATSSLMLTGIDLYRIYMPVYAHSIGLSPSSIGIVVSAFSAAAFVIRLIMQPLINKFKEERMLAASFYLTAVCLILIPLFKGAAILALISFVLGLGLGCGQPIITMMMYSNSPPGRSGEVMGLRMTVIHFTRLLGPVTLGAVGSALGLFPMFALNSLMMATGGWLSQPKRKK